MRPVAAWLIIIAFTMMGLGCGNGAVNGADGFDPRLPGTQWALTDSPAVRLEFHPDGKLLIVENGNTIAGTYEFGEWAGGRLKVTVDSWPWLGPRYQEIGNPTPDPGRLPPGYEFDAGNNTDSLFWYRKRIAPATYPLDYAFHGPLQGYPATLNIADAGGYANRTYVAQ